MDIDVDMNKILKTYQVTMNMVHTMQTYYQTYIC
jgi:hypothetical protein